MAERGGTADLCWRRAARHRRAMTQGQARPSCKNRWVIVQEAYAPLILSSRVCRGRRISGRRRPAGRGLQLRRLAHALPGLRVVADRVRRRSAVGREDRQRLPHATAGRPRTEGHHGGNRRPLVRREIELRRQTRGERALRGLHIPDGRPDVDPRVWLWSQARARRTRAGIAAGSGKRLRPRLAVRHRSDTRVQAARSHPLCPRRARSPCGPGDHGQRPMGPLPIRERAAWQVSAVGGRRTGPHRLDVPVGSPNGPRGLRRHWRSPSSRPARCRARC